MNITPLRVLLHAPTPGALGRARSNARNLLAARSDTQVLIVANADAVIAALEHPDAETDGLLRLCGNTLRNRGLENHPGLVEVAAAVETLATLQSEGWCYIRA